MSIAIYDEYPGDGTRLVWMVERLWGLSESLPTTTVKLQFFQPYVDSWLQRGGIVNGWKRKRDIDRLNLDEFIACRVAGWAAQRDGHLLRTRDADLDYPILFSPDWVLIDGYHRFVKAYINGDDTIQCRRFVEMPEPDRIDKDKRKVSQESLYLPLSMSRPVSNTRRPASAKW